MGKQRKIRKNGYREGKERLGKEMRTYLFTR